MINETWKIDKTFRIGRWTDQKLDKPGGGSGERRTKAKLPVKGRGAKLLNLRQTDDGHNIESSYRDGALGALLQKKPKQPSL